MSEFPSISIVIPCYQAGETLRAALDSLLDQMYPGLEILVVDGGSSDDSAAILREYDDRLTWWVSEPDKGQGDAINKGFARATGDIHGWLCADDVLLPGALERVGRHFSDPDAGDWLAGACEMVYPKTPERDFVFHPRSDFVELIPTFNGIMQPSVFWRASMVAREREVDPGYTYAMDAELWCYLAKQGARVRVIPEVLSRFIQDGANKTASGGRAIGVELDRLYREYSSERVPLSWWYLRFRYPLECTIRRDRGLLRRGLLGCFQVGWMLALAPFYGWRRVRTMSWPA